MEQAPNALSTAILFEPGDDHEITVRDLPDEVLRTVFRHLRRRDCPAVRLTCRHWRDVLDSCLDGLKPRDFNHVFVPKLLPRFFKLETLVVLSEPWCTPVRRDANLSCMSTRHCLKTLILQGTYVQDLRPLVFCPNLQTLHLTRCIRVKDMEPLAACKTLTQLDLSSTAVEDAGPLAACEQLKLLSLRSCPNLRSLGGLLGCSNLEVLDLSELSGVGLQDLGDLSAWTNLRWLNLSFTSTNSLGALTACHSLRTLWVDKCNSLFVGEFEVASVICPALNCLSLIGLGVDYLSFLPMLCPMLVCLRLSYTEVHDITPLSQCTLLQQLYISENFMDDISALSACRQLDTLDISYCLAVSDIAPLAVCTRLENLNLAGSSVSNISPLATCTNLRRLVYPDPDVAGQPEGADAILIACPFLQLLDEESFESQVDFMPHPFDAFAETIIDSILE